MLASENFGLLLEPLQRKVFVNAFKMLPSMLQDLFVMETSSKQEEHDTHVGGFGDIPTFSGRIAYQDSYQQYEKTYSHIEYASGYQIERRLFDDDLYNVMNRYPQALGVAVRRTREKKGSEVFNNAFTGTSGPDALSLSNTAHTSRTPGVSNQSNRGTSALSLTSVESARTSMADFRDWDGELITVMPDMVLAPRELEQTAWEIIASRGKVETAQNNANFHFGKYKLAIWDYLTDANNWFMIDSTLKDMSLLWFDRIPVEFGRAKDFDTFVAKFNVYMRFSTGWSDWRWIFGNLVS